MDEYTATIYWNKSVSVDVLINQVKHNSIHRRGNHNPTHKATALFYMYHFDSPGSIGSSLITDNWYLAFTFLWRLVNQGYQQGTSGHLITVGQPARMARI